VLTIRAVEAHEKYLRNLLESLCQVLETVRVDHRIVGGMAAFLHVDACDPMAARLTPNVDLAIRRSDLPVASQAIIALGLECRYDEGMAVLSSAPTTTAGHLLFAGEQVRPRYLFPVPDFSPATFTEQGFPLIPTADLVHMKLTSLRLVDKTHIIDLDSVGLITPEIENALPDILHERLDQVRKEEAQSTGAE
jgi:hypothetical protein